MLLSSQLLTLPAPLLVFLASAPTRASAQGLEWHSYLRRDERYFPEHEDVYRREIAVQQRLQEETPMAVKKMSADPGEKFFLDYWAFADVTGISTNHTLPSLKCPVRPSSEDGFSPILPRYLDLRRLSMLQQRDFQCVEGTYACTSIGYPNACCSAGYNCVLLDQNTALGNVGCCPQGETCGSAISECEAGYSSCPNYPGGGCCPPGYGCLDVGCVQTASATQYVGSSTQVGASTTTVTSTVTVTPSAGPPETRTFTTTVIVAPPLPTPSTDSYPVTTTVTSLTSVTSTRLTSTTCPPDFHSCPASLGGGCCANTLRCASNIQCLPTTTSRTSATLIPPQRPTTDVTTTRTTSGLPGCPTGFYACSATHGGGCCQTDRQCHTYSCPPSVSTTLLSGSLTAVAPTGSGITDPGNLQTGSCANGWATCAQDVGGGCCPNSYSCEQSSCMYASASVTLTQGKMAPNAAGLSKAMDTALLMVGLAVSSVVLGLGALL